jgi:DNA-binding FrmR family transcriptional regulator
MPYSGDEKKRVITRLRKIKGQAEALERAVGNGTECGVLLQQLAALRGAATGLMAEVLESHLRETFAQTGQSQSVSIPLDAHSEIDQLMRIIRSYLK